MTTDRDGSGVAQHQVLIALFEGYQPLDVTGPHEVLMGATQLLAMTRPEVDGYAVSLVAETPGPVRSTSGLALLADGPLPETGPIGTLLVPGGAGSRALDPDSEYVRWLRRAADRATRVVSVCTGAFALAAAGVLDGRPATTHWRHTAELARAHPEVRVQPDVLYVDEGDVLTSAGVAAGLDLCLHILRKDHGAAFAAAVARRIVVPPHRDGGQAQFIRAPLPARDGSLAATRAWALERLHAPLTVKDLAAHACVSERTLARRWTAETGVPVHRWLLAQRVDAARAALETGDATIEEVARATGFDTAANLRTHFRRRVATTPTAYRRAFSLRPRSSGRANQIPTSSSAIAAGNA
jgi:transcriptional regulator GlxA family with amidase domain